MTLAEDDLEFSRALLSDQYSNPTTVGRISTSHNSDGESPHFLLVCLYKSCDVLTKSTQAN
jgi:hypothetical protein